MLYASFRVFMFRTRADQDEYAAFHGISRKVLCLCLTEVEEQFLKDSYRPTLLL